MHTNTMHHARCQRMPQGKHNAQTHKRTKKHKNKRNVTKTCKNIQSVNKQWRSKKPWQQNETNERGPQYRKGSLKVGPTSQNKTGNAQKRDAHHTNYAMGATPPPPSSREHPEGLPVPPRLWKTLWITPVTQSTMWPPSCGKPSNLWKTLWKTLLLRGTLWETLWITQTACGKPCG